MASAALRDDLAHLATGEGVTIFLTTHNLTEAERLCARVGVIRKGRLVALGSPRELRSGQHVPIIRVLGRGFHDPVLDGVRHVEGVVEARMTADALELRLADGASVAPVVRLLVERGVEIEEVRREHPSFEEVLLVLDACVERPEGALP